MTVPARTGPRVAIALALAAACLGCFEQPITESMEIRFLTAEAAMVRVLVSITDPERFKHSPPARARIEEARRRIEEGRDEWSSRIEAMGPEEERIILDRSQGRVARIERKVVVADADMVHRLFSDTPVSASVRRSADEVELLLVPGSRGRAGRIEEEALQADMQGWAKAVAGYVLAGRRLYDYTEDNPDRAPACFAALFEEVMPEDARRAYGEPTEADKAWIKPLKDAMSDVLALFDVPADAAFSLEERARRVYDPFPAPLTVRVPGPILETEGFEPGGPGILVVRPVGLWSAFTRIHERWISPDPVLIHYEHLRDGERSLDLDDFLRRPRHAAPPSPSEVLRAVRDEMRPAPLYRVLWSAADLAEPAFERSLWDLPELQ